MKKLFYATVGATLTLLSASPAFAQDVPADLTTAVLIRVAQDKNMHELTARTASAPVEAVALEEAVLGETALPVLGVDAPLDVKLDMLSALRAEVAKNRGLRFVPGGLSAD
jgi:hypothetical protein